MAATVNEKSTKSQSVAKERIGLLRCGRRRLSVRQRSIYCTVDWSTISLAGRHELSIVRNRFDLISETICQLG